MEPFWLKERFPTVPEAMGRGQRISFHSSGTVEKAGAERGEGGDGRPTAGQAHHCSSSGELKAAVQLLGQALIVTELLSSHTQNVQTETDPNQ